MGSSGMKRKGRAHLPKIHDVRRPPTLAGNLRSWFLRYPTDSTLLPPPAGTRIEPFGWEWRWLGFALAVFGIRYFAKRHTKSASPQRSHK